MNSPHVKKTFTGKMQWELATKVWDCFLPVSTRNLSKAFNLIYTNVAFYFTITNSLNSVIDLICWFDKLRHTLNFLLATITIRRHSSVLFSRLSMIKVAKCRSSHRRCSIRKGVLRNLAKFTGEHLLQNTFGRLFLKTVVL